MYGGASLLMICHPLWYASAAPTIITITKQRPIINVMSNEIVLDNNLLMITIIWSSMRTTLAVMVGQERGQYECKHLYRSHTHKPNERTGEDLRGIVYPFPIH